MKTKNMILTALFLAIGFILHSSVPGIFGMKFDLFLAFMFLSIVIYPTLQNALLAGAVGARVTGAGFGGCAIALVPSDRVIDFMRIVGINYLGITQLKADFYTVQFVDGVKRCE